MQSNKKQTKTNDRFPIYKKKIIIMWYDFSQGLYLVLQLFELVLYFPTKHDEVAIMDGIDILHAYIFEMVSSILKTRDSSEHDVYAVSEYYFTRFFLKKHLKHKLILLVLLVYINKHNHLIAIHFVYITIVRH
jgi:hypothetical protein